VIQVTPTIAIEETEIREDFIRASGPGGQNVNKVATAVPDEIKLVDEESAEIPITIQRIL